MTSKSAKLEAELPFHPSANVFPLMTGSEFDELVADIERRGLRVPIVTHKGQIIDGRNRARACAKAGVKPRYEEFTGTDEEVDRAIASLNIHRRHLKPEQRREKLAHLLHLHPDRSDRSLAAEAGVDRETVSRARKRTTTGGMPPVDGRVGKRIGRDGKKRRMPTRKAKPNNSRQESEQESEQQTQANTAHPQPCPCPICREQTEAAQDSLERKQARRLEELESRCHKLQTDNGALQSEVATLKAEVSKLQQENAELRAKLVPTQTAIAAAAAQTTSIGPMLPDSVANQADDSPEDDRWIES
jgi:ParB-like chromosome segregation protein Spo0J